MVRRSLVILLAAVTTGCTMSIAERREQPPARAGEFPAAYDCLARCLRQQLEGERGNALVQPYTLDIDPEQRQARVYVVNAPRGDAVLDVVARAVGAGESRVEYRRRGEVPPSLGGMPKYDDRVWAHVASSGKR
jgi:hypothetical protein